MSESQQNSNLDPNNGMNPQGNAQPEEFSTFAGQNQQPPSVSSTIQSPDQGEPAQAGGMATPPVPPTPPSQSGASSVPPTSGGTPPGDSGTKPPSFMSKINLSFLGKIKPQFYAIGITLVVAVIGLAYFINSYLTGTRASTTDITINVGVPDTARNGEEINVGVRLSNKDYFVTGADICLNYNANVMQYVPEELTQISQAPNHFNDKVIDRINDPQCQGGARKVVVAKKSDNEMRFKTVTVYFKFKVVADGDVTFSVNTGNSQFVGNFDENQGVFSILAESQNASKNTKAGAGGRVPGGAESGQSSIPLCRESGTLPACTQEISTDVFTLNKQNGQYEFNTSLQTEPPLDPNAYKPAQRAWWFRRCPVTNNRPVFNGSETSTLSSSSCGKWEKIGYGLGYTGYGAFAFNKNDEYLVYQSVYNPIDGLSDARRVPIGSTDVDWGNRTEWVYIPTPQGTTRSYDAVTFFENGEERYLQTLINADGKSAVRRICDFMSDTYSMQQCSEWQTIQLTQNDGTYAPSGQNSFRGYSAFEYNNSTQVMESFIAEDGKSSWARTCPLNSSGIAYSSCSSWGGPIFFAKLPAGADTLVDQGIFTFKNQSGSEFFYQSILTEEKVCADGFELCSDGKTCALPGNCQNIPDTNCPPNSTCGDNGQCICLPGYKECEGACIPENQQCTCGGGDDDTDDDGIPDDQDADDDNDGIPDVDEGDNDGKPGGGDRDTDGDGIPDSRDIDSDGDGITDTIEAKQSPAKPFTQHVPQQCADADGDGILDMYATGLTLADTDGDGQPDYLDTDADGDGVLDSTEGHDAQQPLGIPDVQPFFSDSDRDGLDDAYDTLQHSDTNCEGWLQNIIGTNAPLQDTDGNGTEDWRDPDDDGDGTPTSGEDTNNDGNWANDDSDNDGIPAYLDPDEGGGGQCTIGATCGTNKVYDTNCNCVCGPGYVDCNNDGQCELPTAPVCEGEVSVIKSIKVKFQGVIPVGGRRPSEDPLNSEVSIVGPNGSQTTRADFFAFATVKDTAGNDVWLWEARDVTFPKFQSASTYKVFIKGPKHLQKKICENNPTESREGGYVCSDGNIQITENAELDFTDIYLLAGDIPFGGGNNQSNATSGALGGQDRIVDSVDITYLRSALKRSQDERKEVQLNRIGDLSLDAIVDAQDYQLAIYSLGFKYDDQLLDDTDDTSEFGTGN